MGSCWPAGSSSEAPTLDFGRGQGRFAGPAPAATEFPEFTLHSTNGDCQRTLFEDGPFALPYLECQRNPGPRYPCARLVCPLESGGYSRRTPTQHRLGLNQNPLLKSQRSIPVSHPYYPLQKCWPWTVSAAIFSNEECGSVGCSLNATDLLLGAFSAKFAVRLKFKSRVAASFRSS